MKRKARSSPYALALTLKSNLNVSLLTSGMLFTKIGDEVRLASDQHDQGRQRRSIPATPEDQRIPKPVPKRHHP